MAWNTNITSNGVQMLNAAIAGEKLTVTSCALNFKFPNLNDEIISVYTAPTVEKKSDYILIRVELFNTELAEKFAELTGYDDLDLTFDRTVNLVSVSVFAKLDSWDYVMDFCRTTADEASYIPISPPSNGNDTLFLGIPIAVSNTANISVKIDDSIHVTAEQFQETVNGLKARINALEGENYSVAEPYSVSDLASQLNALSAHLSALAGVDYSLAEPGSTIPSVTGISARIDALAARVAALDNLSESTSNGHEETPPDDDDT